MKWVTESLIGLSLGGLFVYQIVSLGWVDYVLLILIAMFYMSFAVRAIQQCRFRAPGKKDRNES